MNFYWVYEIPGWLFCILTMSFFVGTSLLGLWITRPLVKKYIAEFEDSNEMIGQFLAALGVFYGITLGLISVGAWENFKSVDDGVSREAASVASLYHDFSQYPDPYKTELTDLLAEYTSYTIKEAWPIQRKGQMPKGGTERMSKIQRTLYNFEPKTQGQMAMHQEAIRQINNVIELRRLRLQSITSGLPATVWYVLIIGAFITISVTWLFVMQRFSLHIWLTIILASMISLLLYLVAAMDNPFRGEYSVSPEAFELIYDRLMKK